MSEENENLVQANQVNKDQAMLSNAEIQRRRNVANNANNISNLAQAASKSANPYAKAAGTVVKAADKISGGKASTALGKTMDRANKFSPGGRLVQKASNKVSESGTSSRISNALSKKKSAVPAVSKPSNTNNAVAPGKDNSFFSKKEVEEQTSDGGGTSFKASVKVLKIGLIAFAPVMAVLVFMNLIVAGSQTYLQVIGLGQADEVSSSSADTAIRENGSEGLDEEITDENVDEGIAGDLTWSVPVQDQFIDDDYSNNFVNKKLNKVNFIASTRDREYNEADLRDLEDYYSNINGYKSQNYNMNTVYKFFFKLFYIQRHYKNTYKVDLDMPLLMATLSIQNSNDISKVFTSNIKGYKIDSEEDGIKENNKYFKYDYDWSNYVISKNSSEHDIEVLAQHMVSKVPYVAEEQTCPLKDVVDGQWCYIIDNDKYKEFLKNFLEKKYFLDEEHQLEEGTSGDIDDSTSNNDSTVSNPFATEMVNFALNEYKNRNNFNAGLKYSQAFGFSGRVEWCAAFVWYVSANTKYNGKSLYPDIIPFKSASTGTYMKSFNSSKESNLKFYYNDSCKNLSGKNGENTKYTPKPGDYIFFDWAASFSYIGDGTQDHTAMVEKYEDGIVYTIEGNSGDKLARLSYNISDCRIIGYGSWY